MPLVEMRQNRLELRRQYRLVDLHDHSHSRIQAGQSGHEKVIWAQALTITVEVASYEAGLIQGQPHVSSDSNLSQYMRIMAISELYTAESTVVVKNFPENSFGRCLHAMK